jgi:DNA topoisomerase I
MTATLQQISSDDLTIRRRRRGRGFEYLDGQGRRLTDAATLQRIRSLAIPPAYRQVRIASRAGAHLQAVGRDDAGRLQYRYHPQWEEVRARRKDGQTAALCAALPRIRQRLARDLRAPGLPRRKVLAAVVTLIDRTHIRIGCEDYVHSGRSRGAATLTKQNVKREGDLICLTFRGKGRQEVECSVKSAPLGRVIGQLARVPGRRLFQYRDEEGRRRKVTASDVNAYLRDISGEALTAKNFRTLAASAAAAEILAGTEPAEKPRARHRQVAEVVATVADMLGNTPTIARKSYILPEVIAAFADGRMAKAARDERKPGLSKGESLLERLIA